MTLEERGQALFIDAMLAQANERVIARLKMKREKREAIKAGKLQPKESE